MQLNKYECVLVCVTVKSHNVLVKHLKLTPSHEDFELKKLLINELVLLSQDSSVLPVSLISFVSLTFSADSDSVIMFGLSFNHGIHFTSTFLIV